MIGYVKINEFGLAEYFGHSNTLPEGTVEVGLDMVAQLPHLMFDGEDWVQRPTLPNHTFSAGTFTQACPAGSYAVVSDGLTRAMFVRVDEEDGFITFNLEDAGNYFVEIYPTGPDLKKELFLNVD